MGIYNFLHKCRDNIYFTYDTIPDLNPKTRSIEPVYCIFNNRKSYYYNSNCNVESSNYSDRLLLPVFYTSLEESYTKFFNLIEFSYNSEPVRDKDLTDTAVIFVHPKNRRKISGNFNRKNIISHVSVSENKIILLKEWFYGVVCYASNGLMGMAILTPTKIEIIEI